MMAQQVRRLRWLGRSAIEWFHLRVTLVRGEARNAGLALVTGDAIA